MDQQNMEVIKVNKINAQNKKHYFSTSCGILSSSSSSLSNVHFFSCCGCSSTFEVPSSLVVTSPFFRSNRHFSILSRRFCISTSNFLSASFYNWQYEKPLRHKSVKKQITHRDNYGYHKTIGLKTLSAIATISPKSKSLSLFLSFLPSRSRERLRSLFLGDLLRSLVRLSRGERLRSRRIFSRFGERCLFVLILSRLLREACFSCEPIYCKVIIFGIRKVNFSVY